MSSVLSTLNDVDSNSENNKLFSTFIRVDPLRKGSSSGDISGLKLDSSNEEALGHVVFLLDKLFATNHNQDYPRLVQDLTNLLRELRANFDRDTWLNIVIPKVRRHPLASLVHECPLTQHSFSRPRGYPGDAGLLDLIYHHESAQDCLSEATVAGRAVFDFTVAVSACEAVRQRRTMLAQKIDEVASTRVGAEILSVACGHLREAELSNALVSGSVGKLIATDQDRNSLNVVAGYADSISNSIETRQLSVRDFLGNRHTLAGFDLVYAAGLYDYLDERLASRLTRRLFSLLNPGGRLLVANFLNDIWEIPYMEAYMDWHLLYRSEAQIRAFASEIPLEELNKIIYFEDDAKCVGYLELLRV